MIHLTNDEVKTIVECGGFALALFTAWEGLQKAHQDRRDSLEQAKKDLLWRQTVEAQNALRRMVNNQLAQNAMTMLDWNNREYELPNGTRVRITWKAMRSSLRTSNLHFQPMETFVRSCFDALFDELQMIQQEIDNGMFGFAEVQYPIGYYVVRMKHQDNWKSMNGYLTRYGFKRALRLIDKTFKEARAHPDDDIGAVFSDIDSAKKEEREENAAS